MRRSNLEAPSVPQTSMLITPRIAPAAFSLALLAAACGSAAPGWETEYDDYDESLACPEDLNVRIITPARTPQGERVWLLEESLPDNAASLYSDGPGDAGWVELNDQAARQYGASLDRRPIWVFVNDNTPPCKMTVGRYWAIRNAFWDEDIRVVAQLGGECHLGFSRNWAIAIQDDGRPNGCYMRPTADVSSSSQGDTPEIDFPDPFASVMDPATCPAPDCQLLWHLNGLRFEHGFRVHEITVSRALSQLDRETSGWSITDYYSVFIEPQPGAKLQIWPEGAGVIGGIYDVRGVRALVTNEAGVLSVFGPPEEADQPPVKISSKRWRRLKPDEYVIHSAWPYRAP